MNREFEQQYWEKRGFLEPKHKIMVLMWLNHFKDVKTCLDCGCGRGEFVYSMLEEGIDCYGFDISEYAIKNSPYSIDPRLSIANILDDLGIIYDQRNFDLVLCIDILEHLDNENQVDITLQQISKICGKYCIFSVPFIGDPNLEKDPTHKIKKTKEWWLYQLSKYFIISEAPKDWPYSNQFLTGERK